MSVIIVTLIIGLSAGILSGLLGLGGGAVLVPAMIFLLGISQHTAQGISMIVIIPTALAGIMQLHKNKLVNYQAAAFLAAGAICGTLISSNLVQYIPAADLKRIFGAFVIYTGAKMVLAKQKK